MIKTEFKNKLIEKYKINNYRIKKYEKGILLTTDNGFWSFISYDDYKKLKLNVLNPKSHTLDPKLINKLEEDGIIITKSNQEKIIKQYKDYYWHLFTGTSLHVIVPTLRCNHTCIYCYAIRRAPDEKGFDMTKKTAKNLIEFIYQSPAHSIRFEFTGGEPLMNFRVIKYMVKYALELNKKYKREIDFAIITNATLLDDKMVKFFKKYGVGLCFSLDGPKKLHDAHRRFFNDGRGTYDEVVELINKIKNEYDYEDHLNAVPVITKLSVPYWKEIVDEYVKHGFKNLRLKYMTCFGFADKAWDKIGYTYQEYLKLWKNSVEYMIKLNKKGVEIRDGISTTILTKILKHQNPGYGELEVPCGAVLGQMVYTENGDVYPCDEARIYPEFKLGNVNENNYKEITSHSTACSMISASSNLSLLCDSCPWFSYCGLCPLQTYSMQKSLVTKLPFDIKCKMHKEMINYLFEKILFNEEDAKILKSWIGMHDTF